MTETSKAKKAKSKRLVPSIGKHVKMFTAEALHVDR